MKIQTLMMRRLINTGNYENTAYEITAELADGDDLWQVGEALAAALVHLARAERDRRYPDPDQRRWHMWIEEDEWEQARADETRRAAQAAAALPFADVETT